MKTVNVHQAKTSFSALLAEIESNGEAIVICRNGKPVANLAPYRRKPRGLPHPILSKIKINYDPTEPAREDEWPSYAR